MLSVLNFLAEYPLVALVLVLACGYALGKIKVAGISLGAAAILFVAIGVSAANPEITFPPLLYQFGLALFVYSIGLSAGREFFATFPTRGWKSNAVIAFVMVMLTVLAATVIHFWMSTPRRPPVRLQAVSQLHLAWPQWWRY